MEIAVLAILFALLVALLIVAPLLQVTHDATSAIITWAGLLVAAIIALARGGSDKTDPPKS